MATLLLTSAVSATGVGGLLGTGLRLAASLGGGLIDNAVFGTSGATRNFEREGPRLKDVHVMSAAEGAPIARLFGRSRIGGQLIWATRFREQVETTTNTSQSAGGKGGGGSARPQSVTKTTNYRYFVSFAVSFCEGEAAALGRVWADGKPLDLASITHRFYPGNDTQMPDSYIETIEDTGQVPAYRGICYTVFENVDLSPFGNRIPQISAEIIKPIINGEIEGQLAGVALIPGSGEFVYGTRSYVRSEVTGDIAENVNNSAGVADMVASLDHLNAVVPAVKNVSLVTSWFGDDLRAGNSTVKPCVELIQKTVVPQDWRVDGVARAGATEVSRDALGRPALGGTPSDHTIVEAIAELKSRGLAIVFYPFLLMDIKAGNAKPDPYGGTEQAAYPWRGRITCHPAPGQTGSPDKTATAKTQVDAFFGNAQISDFTTTGTQVDFTGSSSEWGYRRMVLHYAKLCAAAGGVDGFAIGSELRGLTQVRSGAGVYPAVAQLVQLAADVKTILGSSTKVTYAADWSEYHSHRPADGTGDVYFNLDPLWSSANIDAIGIDNYVPLADWRDGTSHTDYDASSGITSTYVPTYLQGNIEGGEYFDWYYASDADRASQTRTTITDGSGKPWVFRNKDLRGWWQNLHYDRPAGVEATTATAWTAQSKPLWFTEFGCPAIDKGANQPNVFYDPKSSESQVPYFSSAARDDVIQRAYLTAHLDYWTPSAGNNPTSSVYSAPMVDTAAMFAWAWDARPFPDFPLRADVWSDAPNFDFGHWLGGRLGRVPLGALVKQLCASVGVSTVDTSGLDGINLLVGGFVIDTISSVRSMLEPLMRAYQFDVFESGGTLCFVRRGLGVVASLTEADLVLDDAGDIGFQTTRAQETELPRSVKLTFLDEDAEYRTATAEGRKLTGSSVDVVDLAVPVVLSQGYARGLAELALQNAWISRETVSAALAPSFLRLDPGDVVNLDIGGQSRRLQITGMDTGVERQVELKSHGEAEIYRAALHPGRQGRIGAVTVYGPTVLAFLDIPLLPGGETEPQAPRLAAHQLPWPGTVSVYRSVPGGGGYTRVTDIDTPAVMGELTTDLSSGPVWRWDNGNSPTIQLYAGELSSATQDNVLNGANVLAVENSQNGWEILQFTNATLLGSGLYQISGLLRGQRGSEGEMRDPVSAGARVVVIDPEALEILSLAGEQRLLPLDYRYGPGAYDHSHFTYTQTARSFAGVGLRPYAPVHVTAVKASGGDITFAWVRRTRIGGDIWDNADVPLSEEREAFEVDIVDAGTVKRTLAASSPQAVYTSAAQIADFGAPQTAYTIRITQLSAAFGRGEPKEVTLNV